MRKKGKIIILISSGPLPFIFNGVGKSEFFAFQA